MAQNPQLHFGERFLYIFFFSIMCVSYNFLVICDFPGPIHYNKTAHQNHNVVSHGIIAAGNTEGLIQNKSMKYILSWTPQFIPFHLLQTRRDAFIDNKCKYTNCFVTFEKNYLKDVKDYDAILFSGCSLRKISNIQQLPQSRSRRQKYVFTTLESSILYPITNPMYDDFFNWTWTTRLRSDISWNYLAIFDINGTRIGPAKNMKWPKEFKPINEEFKKKLKRKTKAAAWFVSHCVTHSGRENFVVLLKDELKKYGWTVDVYGTCAKDVCRSFWGYKMLERDYFFYLSFENSFEEDYVTEKLLTPLKNTVVPVVYGGANYSRFLPPGSYLDARELGHVKLAKAMDDAITNPTSYYKFFSWKNHFTYEKSDSSSDLCNICTALNDETMVKRTSTYKNFRVWWNGAKRQNLYEVMLKNFVMNGDLQKLAAGYNYTRTASLVLLKNIRNQTKDWIPIKTAK